MTRISPSIRLAGTVWPEAGGVRAVDGQLSNARTVVIVVEGDAVRGVVSAVLGLKAWPQGRTQRRQIALAAQWCG